MPEVIFQITTDNLETGMRGFPVGYCPTSSVDPEKGLFYIGKPVSELAYREPEEVMFLIYYEREGTEEEVKDFSDELAKRGRISDELVSAIRNLPRKGHPIKLYAAALLLAGMIEGKGDYREDCLNVIAKNTSIVAEVINHHAGWGGCKPYKPQLGYIENFTQMLNAPNVNLNELTQALKHFHILHYDHGGGNLSAFTGKVIASGLQDMYASLSGAMCSLGGPLHGKANQDSLDFVKSVLDKVGVKGTEKDVEEYVRDCLANHKLIYGFGHAVLRVEDPRATVFYELAQEKYPNHPLVKTALLLRKAGTKVLKESPKVKNPHPNIDAISGSVLSAAGFPYPEYYTVLFGLSRVIGIARQIVYERLEARDGKGTPIIRPKYFYRESK